VNGATDRCHVTIDAETGGTPSPWRPDRPGRVLELRCLTCGGDFSWDYFADSAQKMVGGRVGVATRPRADVLPGRLA
jgi:hypothetical protein